MLRLSAIACLLAAASFVDADYPYRAPMNILPAEGCTAIVVDPHASLDGGMTTHTNDCHQCDPRISNVPAQDWPEGSTRPVYSYRSQYPRYLGPNRGAAYEVENTDLSFYPWEPTKPIAEIPQVKHTYAYIDGNYGIQNEHQVAMGESTCSARFVALPIHDGGHAMLDIQNLSRLGLERAKTAREACQIMGDLAVKYGYFGAEWKGAMAEGEAGEVLVVSDPHEAFAFHILPDSTGKSAIWAAQKIPKGHLALCANAFFIKEIDFKDDDNFMYSDNVVSEAIKAGFYEESYGPFHFTHSYGLITTFESYSSRRAWRVFSMVAPSRNFPSNSTVATLPFSVKPDRMLNKTDLMWIQRDHYEGTEFDQTAGLQSGPFGNPNRYDRSMYYNISIGILMQGNFERTISLHRTIYSFVTTSRSFVPNLLSSVWFGAGIPHATLYEPVYVSSEEVKPPHSLTVGGLHGFDKRSTFWAATAVAGWMEKSYKPTAVKVIAAQSEIERRQNDEIIQLEKKVIDILEDKKISTEKAHNDAVKLLSDFTVSNNERVLSTWWTLFENLMTSFHDGFIVRDVHVDAIAPYPTFYPLYWLKDVGFFPPETDWNKKGWSPDEYAIHPPTIPPEKRAKVNFNEMMAADVEGLGVCQSSSNGFMSTVIAASAMMIGVVIGVKITQKQQQAKYEPLEAL